MIRKLTEYLDDKKVKYMLVSHPVSFTAQEIAQSAHISGEEIAKTVIVWMDGSMVMVVLPGSHMIDFVLLRSQCGARDIELANELEFMDRFPECEIGAMPPFGNLFNMKVFAASSLRERPEIVFNAGSHREMVSMAYEDFERLVNPVVISFSFRRKAHEEDIPTTPLWERNGPAGRRIGS
ncbi:MAG TPA: YbaK/EbsC family protein [Bacteroidota bacterium]